MLACSYSTNRPALPTITGCAEMLRRRGVTCTRAPSLAKHLLANNCAAGNCAVMKHVCGVPFPVS